MFRRQMIFFVIVFVFVRCSDNKITDRKKFGKYFIEANLENDTLLDGVVKFFKSEKDKYPVSVEEYSNGIRNGFATTYYENGLTKDSMFFEFGKRHGFEFAFDQLGNLNSVNYQYYGLKMGPQILLSNNRVADFSFVDFNNEDLVVCKYDSIGKLKEISSYMMGARIMRVITKGEKMVNLFTYLPDLPNTETLFKVGLVNSSNIDSMLFSINNRSVIFDTLLPYPPKGSNYFISSQVKSKQKDINKLFIEEIRLSE